MFKAQSGMILWQQEGWPKSEILLEGTGSGAYRCAMKIYSALLGVIVSVTVLADTSSEGPALESNKERDKITAMQGKPAPALHLKNWLNSKPLGDAELK